MKIVGKNQRNIKKIQKTARIKNVYLFMLQEESGNRSIAFHESIYWATVTVTTVGYGDYSPSTWLTQVLVVLLLVSSFAALPYLTGKLLQRMSRLLMPMVLCMEDA